MIRFLPFIQFVVGVYLLFLFCTSVYYIRSADISNVNLISNLSMFRFGARAAKSENPRFFSYMTPSYKSTV